MSLLHNSIYIFNAIPVKKPERYFANVRNLVLKFVWSGHRSRIANIAF